MVLERHTTYFQQKLEANTGRLKPTQRRSSTLVG